MRNIQPWCISRQLWWGHQIPAWYDDEGGVYVAHDEPKPWSKPKKNLAAKSTSPATKTFGHMVFFALWPFSTLGWPEKTPDWPVLSDGRSRHGL